MKACNRLSGLLFVCWCVLLAVSCDSRYKGGTARDWSDKYEHEHTNRLNIIKSSEMVLLDIKKLLEINDDLISSNANLVELTNNIPVVESISNVIVVTTHTIIDKEEENSNTWCVTWGGERLDTTVVQRVVLKGFKIPDGLVTNGGTFHFDSWDGGKLIFESYVSGERRR